MATLLETRIQNRYPVQPNHANSNQTLHGGTLMKWLDEVGGMAAATHAGYTCVTARVNELDFQRPVEIGDVALVEGYVYDSGRTSVQVALRAWRENLQLAERQQTTESTFTFVAIDEAGQPVEVPELVVETDEGQRLRDRVLSDSA